MRKVLLCLSLICFISPELAFAKAKKKRKSTKRKYQIAIVVTEGAAVYKFPNFDSPVIDYLSRGKQLPAAKKRYKGIGGFGAFVKIRLGKKKFGYISDIDVQTQYRRRKGSKKLVEKNPNFKTAKEELEETTRESFYFTRYLGGQLGLLGFSEKFSGQKLSSDVFMLGLKITGPKTLFDGPPLDFTLSISNGAPGHYDEFSSSPASGFFIFSDLLMLMPLLDYKTSTFYFGFGLMSTYTRFSVKVRNTSFDSQELRVGGAASLGYGFRFSRYALRFESKYYYETTAYLGHWLSFQVEYK